ncbi:hypothetical protein BB559_005080 [Furculomyces boomerangus]|uniref:Uncharacterized protein n=2 Tax=Harpellales TaxID=61421 RepID=A0A2T9YB30_9FUNG|nr:hypothetical protein BB559_005080 [Furculomyces boomerangus]PWA00204.1 hypothetical protein BB558_003759 [Smittium angustum]
MSLASFLAFARPFSAKHTILNLTKFPLQTQPATKPLGSLLLKHNFQTLQPRSRKYKKAQTGTVPVRTGGSTKGNYLAFGNYGLRVKLGCRLRAKILTSIYASVRRKIKSAKDSKIYLRVFPDIPVSSKGSEARMGKGKGSFDYYAARVPKDKILFEIGGPNLSVELAREAFRLASHKLPVDTEFVVLSEKTKQPAQLPPTTVPFLHAK